MEWRTFNKRRAAVILSPALTAAALATRGWRLGRALGEANKAAMADLADNLAGLRLLKIFAAEDRCAAAGLYLSIFAFNLPLAEALVLMLAYGRLLQAALRVLSAWRRLTGASSALVSYDETLAACRAAAEPPAAGLTAPVLRREIRLSGVVVRHDERERPTPVISSLTASR